jgi:hypothetical protein
MLGGLRSAIINEVLQFVLIWAGVGSSIQSLFDIAGGTRQLGASSPI